MTMASTIMIDKEALTRLLVGSCPHHFYNTHDGDSCERKVNKETCELNVYADMLRCPHDCPRLLSKDYSCDKGRCPRIKGLINSLKATTK